MSHERYQSIIDTCYDCATECLHCQNACLEEDNVNEMIRCIKLDNDCATICLVAATMMAGGSEFAKQVSQLCSSLCDACAEECEKHSNMEHCKKCAEKCRKCAEACREIK